MMNTRNSFKPSVQRVRQQSLTARNEMLTWTFYSQVLRSLPVNHHFLQHPAETPWHPSYWNNWVEQHLTGLLSFTDSRKHLRGNRTFWGKTFLFFVSKQLQIEGRENRCKLFYSGGHFTARPPRLGNIYHVAFSSRSSNGTLQGEKGRERGKSIKSHVETFCARWAVATGRGGWAREGWF